MAVNPHGLNIDMTQFTTNVTKVTNTKGAIEVTGDGIYDIIMMTATKHLSAQYENERIRGEDYANAYIQLMQSVLQAAVQIWIQKNSEKAKEDLYRRQIKGFDDDQAQKLLKTSLDAWLVAYSVNRGGFANVSSGSPESATATQSSIPSPIQTPTLTALFNHIILPSLEKYDWYEESHPDATNRKRLSDPLKKFIMTENAPASNTIPTHT